MATVPEFFTYVAGILIVLFVATLIILFVYEYDSLRRERA